MKIVVVLCFVLVLALIGGAAAGEKRVEDEAEDGAACINNCVAEKLLEEQTCKESCALIEQFGKTVWAAAFRCGADCAKLDDAAGKACVEKCDEVYKLKEAKTTDSCSVACRKAEKDPAAIEKCKEICTPAIVMKKLQEAARAVEAKKAGN